MVKVNDNYLKLPGSYLFSTIAKKVNAYTAANPDKKIIRLGIGDVTQPLSASVISALHSAVDEMADAATFHGYAPDLGYEFLRKDVRLRRMKFLFRTVRSAIPATYRRFSRWIIELRSAIRYIRFMWTPMSWREERVHTTRRLRDGAM